jgi:hypothetical protein
MAVPAWQQPLGLSTLEELIREAGAAVSAAGVIAVTIPARPPAILSNT